MNSAVIVACMLTQEDDVEPVYTELKRENEEDKSKIIICMTLCCLCITKQEYMCVHMNYEIGDYKVQLAAKYIVYAGITALRAHVRRFFLFKP